MAHKIDTETAVEVMPVAAAAGTPGWFTDADPLNPTHLDADFCNMVQGELTNIVLAFGGSLTKGVVDQIATALTEYVLTNGRFSDSLYAIYDATPGVEDYLFKVTGTTSSVVSAGSYNARHGYRSGSLSDYVLVDKDLGISFVKLVGAVPTIMAAIDRVTGDIATSGKAEVTGKITVGGTFGGPADAPIPVTQRALTASVDWATSAADIEGSPVVSYEDSTEVEITLTIANSDSGPHDVEMGSTVLIDISGIQATGGTLISAFAHTTAGSTNAQKGLRWSCGIMLNSSGNPKLAVTSVGKATAGIAGSGAESVTVKIYLTFAALKAV